MAVACIAVLLPAADVPAAQAETRSLLAQSGRSCKTAISCRDAVIMWCNGYRRADGDDDGIPCENVCPNKVIVDRIRAEIGC